MLRKRISIEDQRQKNRRQQSNTGDQRRPAHRSPKTQALLYLPDIEI